jgi:hypothetical protein
MILVIVMRLGMEMAKRKRKRMERDGRTGKEDGVLSVSLWF